jgi:hypothetical protein
MWFAQRFSLLFFLLIAPFATTGLAATSRCDGIAWIAAFTPVPEINPAWTAVGSCILATALILRHSAKFRK